jgi:hypothetical protein
VGNSLVRMQTARSERHCLASGVLREPSMPREGSSPSPPPNSNHGNINLRAANAERRRAVCKYLSVLPKSNMWFCLCAGRPFRLYGGECEGCQRRVEE